MLEKNETVTIEYEDYGNLPERLHSDDEINGLLIYSIGISNVSM